MTSAQTAEQKRKGTGWTIRPPRVVDLIEARQVAEQVVRMLEAIPSDLADQLEKELDEASSRVSEERSKRDLAFGLKTLLNCTAHNGHPKAAGRDGARRLLQEIQTQPKSRVTLPGPARPGYVKELVIKYKLRPIPYGAQLTGGYIHSSSDVLKLFGNLRYETKEHIFTVHLNNANQILSVNHVATGSMNECTVCLGEVFRDAFLAGASALIFVHNHPSGRAEPSSQDRYLLDELRRVSTLLRIAVIDFVVLGDHNHWSASDHGLLHQAGIPSLLPSPVKRRPTAAAVKGRRGKG
jgi:DNA repair protein RadC